MGNTLSSSLTPTVSRFSGFSGAQPSGAFLISVSAFGGSRKCTEEHLQVPCDWHLADLDWLEKNRIKAFQSLLSPGHEYQRSWLGHNDFQKSANPIEFSVTSPAPSDFFFLCFSLSINGINHTFFCVCVMQMTGLLPKEWLSEWISIKSRASSLCWYISFRMLLMGMGRV